MRINNDKEIKRRLKVGKKIRCELDLMKGEKMRI